MNKEYLLNHLESMWNRGLIECHATGNTRTYNAVPWIPGMYEVQLKFIDKEFAHLHTKYIKTVGHYHKLLLTAKYNNLFITEYFKMIIYGCW